MDSDTNKLHSKLSALNVALDDLEKQIGPLLSQTLPESVVGLEPIQQAKLQVAVPYLVYDLVFIYLKTRGIDPKTHPVIAELDRVRQYFDKIKNAEDPAKRAVAVDKAAANRFIKHAIAQVKAQRPPGDDEAGPSRIRFDEDNSEVRVPVKVTSKMLARAQYEKELAELGSEEEDDLKVIGDAEDTNANPESNASRKQKGKEKAMDVDGSAKVEALRKRRRPTVDIFAGYGDDQPKATVMSQPTKKSKASLAESPPNDVDMDDTPARDTGRNTPQRPPNESDKPKKAKKKAKTKSVG